MTQSGQRYVLRPNWSRYGYVSWFTPAAIAAVYIGILRIERSAPIMARTILYSLVAAIVLALGAPAAAGELKVQVVFTDAEASTIRAYYRDHLAPQMGKKKGRKGLPPGIAKNLQRGKPLPPGIAKQVLPTGLVNLLPPPPRGFERVVLSGKVLLVEIATQVIHDVLEDVILGK